MTRPAAVLALALACGAAPQPPLPAAQPTVVRTRTIQREGTLRLDEVTWRCGEETGKAWLASGPSDAALRISASDTVVPFGDLLPSAGAWAAVNGGFYEGDRAMGLVVSGGRERSTLSPRGGSGVVAAMPGGLDIFHRDAWIAGPREALQSIDRLVDAGANLVTAKPNATLTARTAVVRGGGRSWLVALAGDRSIGRSPRGGYQLHDTTGAGLSLHDFAAFLLVATRAEKALNLDGAVSTQLVVSGARRFEVLGERGTINAVILDGATP